MRILAFNSSIFFVLLFFYACKKKQPEPPVDLSLMHRCIYETGAYVRVSTLDTIPAGDYIFNCSISIESGGHLVIMPGTTLRFNYGDGISVSTGGKLTATGTDSLPINFTSVDEVRASWSGISSSNGDILMVNCTTMHGSNHSGVLFWAEGGTASFEKCKFSDAEIGLFLEDGYEELVTLNKLEGNTFEKTDWPLSVCIQNINTLKGGNTFTNNSNQYIRISKNCNAGYTSITHFYKNEVPFLIVPPDDCLSKQITLESNVIIDPGTQIVMSAGSVLAIEEGFSFICNGTAAEHISFSGKEHTKGYWGSVVLMCDTTDVHSFEFTDFSDGGGLSSDIDQYRYGYNLGMLYTGWYTRDGYQLNIKHCSISNALYYGVYLYIDNGTVVNGASGFTAIHNALVNPISGNTFTNCTEGSVLVDTIF